MAILTLLFNFFSIERVIITFSLMFFISSIFSVGKGISFLLNVLSIFFVIDGAWIVNVKVEFLFCSLVIVISSFIFFVRRRETVRLISVSVVGLSL